MMWRSLDELDDAPAVRQWREREFPPGASEWVDDLGRREFLRIMGASLALAGATACTRQPLEKIVPYVRQPELVVPGERLYFASAHLLGGYARGILVESHEGRPTKVEGNPDHPASLGATDVFMQASVLDLYDPDRSKSVMHLGQPSTWEDFQRALSDALTPLLSKGGQGVRILTETVTSPTLIDQMNALGRKLPEMRWLQYEPLHRGHQREGTLLAFGQAVDPIYHFEKADVIVSLDADFLARGPASVRSVREYANRRRVALEGGEMCRLFVAEPCPTITGAMADHRLPVRAGDVEDLAGRLHAALLKERQARGWLEMAANELLKHKGKGIVVAGDEQPREVHAMAHAMNALLGNIGNTVTYIAPPDTASTTPERALSGLVGEMQRGLVEILIILGGNPVYKAPAELEFSAALEHVPLRLHLGLHDDETAARCHWHAPQAHGLESWSDARAFDGTATIIQPLIEPLFRGHTAHEVLATLLGDFSASGLEIVRQYWVRAGLDDRAWRQALSRGVIEKTAAEPKQVTAKTVTFQPPEGPQKGLEAAFRPDPNVLDGCYANNAWLQELPRPLTKLSWDNGILLSPTTAGRLHLKSGDVVELRQHDRLLRGPVLVVPGHADDAVTIHLGYGRGRAGRVGTGVGIDANQLRSVGSPFVLRGLEALPSGEHVELAFTQHHHDMEGRDLVRVFGSSEALNTARDFSKLHPPRRPMKRFFIRRSSPIPVMRGAWSLTSIPALAATRVSLPVRRRIISP